MFSNFSELSATQTRKIVATTGLVGVLFFLVWFYWGFRINVPQDKILVLINKFGTQLAPDRIIATQPGQKGIQFEVKSEGWHWYNSFFWQREIHDATKIEASSLGVLVRLYGKNLAPGEIIASPLNLKVASDTDTKGIVAEVLKPGKYNINPYAYRVEKHPVTEIPAGHVGIVVNRMGTETQGFNYVSKTNMRGVQPVVKEPGTYYMNPFLYKVIPYNIRIQKTDFDGVRGLSFMSYDSYEIKMTATIEWRVDPQRVPLVYSRIGDINSVQKEVINPYARSLCRLIGSESYAKDYISGESRKSIQIRFKDMLEAKCNELGILISSVVIKKIIPPSVLRQIINTRGLEKETREKLNKEIEKVKSDARVAKGKEEIKKGQAKVQENITHKKLMTKAIGDREILIKNAKKRLAIAKVELESAKVERQTIVERGRAEILKEFNVREAEVEQLKNRIKAMGGGKEFARFEFNSRIRLQEVMTSDNSELAHLLNQFGARRSE